LRKRIRGGDPRLGGVKSYPLERLFEEIAYVAYHFKWDQDRIMSMEHRDRQRWVSEIARINQRMNEDNTGKERSPW
jgi:hypothetical protein